MVEPIQNLTAYRTLERLARLSWNSTYIGDKVYEPQSIVRLSPTILRKFVCTEGCVSCCLQGPLTLDFIPEERAWHLLPLRYRIHFESRVLLVNGRARQFFSYMKPKGHCPLMSEVRNGSQGCSVWPMNPIECAASARITIQSGGLEGGVRVQKRLFGRAWRYNPPVQCEYPPIENLQDLAEELDKDIAVFHRYLDWGQYFGIHDTAIPWIIDQLEYAKVFGEFRDTTQFPKGILPNAC